MGLFDLFRKKPSATEAQANADAEADADTDTDVDEPRVPGSAQVEATRVPYAHLAVGATTDDVRASKLGGIPYRPRGGAHDAILDAATNVFIAQIRCDELPPAIVDLHGFPRRGLLQFWLGKHDLLEGVGKRTDGTVCLYYPAFEEPQLDGWAPDFTGEYTSLREPDVGKRLLISGHTETQPSDSHEATGHRIAGYCAFTQEDPRSPDDPMVSLLQLDSDADVFWGDTGIAHWFLREDDLRACAFDRTRFYWDCC